MKVPSQQKDSLQKNLRISIQIVIQPGLINSRHLCQVIRTNTARTTNRLN